MWLARPIGLQLFSRALQGIADAVIFITGLAVIIDTVGTKRVAEYMGYVSMALNVGTFAGPLLGGAIFEAGGYHAVWAMIMGFVVLDAILRLIMIEKKETFSGQPNGSCPPGAIEAARAEGKEQANPMTTISSTKTKTTKTQLSWQRVPDMLLLLKSPRMITACLAICVQSMVFSGVETVLSIYVQDIWGYNALGAGLIFIPLTIPAFFASFIGRVVDRTSTRWALTAGFLGMCPIITLMRYVTYDSMAQKVLLCFFLVAIGLGITIILGPSMAEVSHIAEEFVKCRSKGAASESSNDRGAYAQAYAINAMAWSCGNVAGPLLCGLINDEASWGTMCWVAGLISGLTAIPCFIWSGRSRTPAPEEHELAGA